MNVHILNDDGSSGSRLKFLCGLMRNTERSFVTLEIYREGKLKPTGKSQFCPICKAAVPAAI